ncbi:MAG: hypothetical protein MZV70_30690 [Desulfobacterales bacterium]|nr:hypothetical protein [Desulfobacterales bacterium]
MNIPEPERMDQRRLESINIINALSAGHGSRRADLNGSLSGLMSKKA